MTGANGTMSIPRFGAVRFKVMRLTHGVSIVAYAGQSESRKRAAFYPSKRTSGSFEMRVTFTTYEGYERVNTWLEHYANWVSDPKTEASPARVVVPAANFDKIGVLESGITFGDTVGPTSWTIDLAFVGTRDPVGSVYKKRSRYLPPQSKDPALPYFYPAGVQLEGKESGWDYKMDNGLPHDIPEDIPVPDLDFDIDPFG